MELLALTWDNLPIVAIIPNFDSTDDALQILENSSFISNSLGKSFQTLWDGIIFNTTSSFWRAVIVGALDFALLGMILYAWNGFKADNDKQQKLIIEGITMIFILALLLGGNGVLTSNILAITHAFDVNLNRNLAELQVIDLSIANSLKNISLSNTAKDRVDKLLSECDEQSGAAGIECLQKQQAEIEKIVDWAVANDPIANSPAARYGREVLDFIRSQTTDLVEGRPLSAVTRAVNSVVAGNQVMMGVIKLVFGAIQLAFNFALEIASLLHALLLPLVIGVVFTPVGAKYVETWIQGYVQIVSIKFLYTVLIGLAAEAIVLSEAQFATGIPFLVFSSVMGPVVAFLMAKGGGADLAKFISSSTTSALSNAVQGGAALATGGASGLGGLVGKSAFTVGSKGLARRTTRRSL